MTGRHTVLITGGTGSVGFHTAKAIPEVNDDHTGMPAPVYTHARAP